MTQHLYDRDHLAQEHDRLQERFTEAAAVIDQLAAIERRFRDLEQTHAAWQGQVEAWPPVRDSAEALVARLGEDTEAFATRLRAFDESSAERLAMLEQQAHDLRTEQRAALAGALEHHQQRVDTMEQEFDARWDEVRVEMAAHRTALEAAAEQRHADLAMANDQRWVELRAELGRSQEQIFAAHDNLRAEVELRLTGIRGELEQRIAVLRHETDTRIAALQERYDEAARRHAEQVHALQNRQEEEAHARSAQLTDLERRLAQQIAVLADRTTATDEEMADLRGRFPLIRLVASIGIGLGAPALLLGLASLFFR